MSIGSHSPELTLAASVVYDETRPQQVVRRFRYGASRSPSATGSSSHGRDGVRKPDILVWSSFPIAPRTERVRSSTSAAAPAWVTHAAALLGVHKTDTAVVAEAASRRCFAQLFIQLASANEALGTTLVYGLVKTRYSRVLALSPGAFAVEVRPQFKVGVPLSAVDFLRQGDLFARLAHDLSDSSLEDVDAGVQPLWDAILVAINVLSEMPLTAPLPRIPVTCPEEPPGPAHASIIEAVNDSRKAVSFGHTKDVEGADELPFDYDADMHAADRDYAPEVAALDLLVVPVLAEVMDTLIDEYVKFAVVTLRSAVRAREANA